VGIVPIGYGIAVYGLNQRILIPAATLTITNNQNTTYTGQAIFSGGATQIINSGGNSFKMTILGSLVSSSLTEFGDNKVVQTQGQTKIMPACDPNVPQAYNLGDIQANFGSSFSTRDPSAFIYATDLFTEAEESKSEAYTFAEPGSNQLANYDALPQAFGGNIWYDTADGYLSSNISDAGALVVQLDTIGNFTFTRILDVVCPGGELVSVSGCYDCDSGCSAILSLKSTCMPGVVMIQADESYIDINTISLVINNTLSEYYIFFVTSQGINNFNMIIIGTGENISIPITFTAVQSPDIDNRTQTHSDHSYHSGDHDWSSWSGFKNGLGDFFKNDIGKFFDRIFKGLGKWWEYLIGAIIIIIIIFATLLLFPSFKNVIGSIILGPIWFFKVVKDKFTKTPKAKQV
jgi:hypothetical protein